MSDRVNAEELTFYRNNMPIREVIYALRIPWRMDDQLCRFQCPSCKGWDSTLHPKENIGRCFSCNRNYNPIDLAEIIDNKGFRTAIEWLRVLRNFMHTEEYSKLITTLACSSQIS
jgi:hypothetical protein